MNKDIMTLPGIGPERKGSLYRELDEDIDILYVETEKFLIRQVTTRQEDIELTRESRKNAARNTRIYVKDSKGKIQLVQIDELIKDLSDTDEELKERIERVDPDKNDDGSIALFVFLKATGEFIASVDIQPTDDNSYDSAAVLFTFSIVPKTEKKYGKKVRKEIKDMLTTSGMYIKCKELIWNGAEYILRPM